MSERMEEMKDLTRDQKLRVDIDQRLLDADLMEGFDAFEDDDLRRMAIRIARVAYYKGYRDAWTEIRPASLFRDHGYEVPARAKA